MNKPVKQHLIDPEICIRCYTCEMSCPIEAIVHDGSNVVVDADKCNFCMDCIPVCPTGSIDEWRVVNTPYTLEEQFGFTELPPQEDLGQDEASTGLEALDDAMAALLADAHKGAGGKAKAPASATKPSVNMYTLGKPATAKVYMFTNDDGHDVRHIILDFGGQPFPALEGQSIGIIPPGTSADGKPHLPRLYSISSPRDGERANYNNLSLTVKREEGGLCSNYVCDLKKGDEVQVTGPFGATFLMPDDPSARLLMICTGTGSAPMRAFTMRRQRTVGEKNGGMLMFFGARSPGALPYFTQGAKVGQGTGRAGSKEYVQDRMRSEEDAVAEMLQDPKTHIYICGLRGMEEGVEQAFTNIAESFGQQWTALRDTLRTEGRYHVETY